MIELIKCGLMIIFYLIVFLGIGYTIGKVMRYKTAWAEYVLIGFLWYYALFQGIALPMIFMKKSLSLLTYFWCAVVLILSVVCFLLVYRKRKTEGKHGIICSMPEMKNSIMTLIKNPFAVLFACFLVFTCYFTAIQNEWGWDTAYYIGTVSTTVDTNTMYQYCGETGRNLKEIPFRYALSAFYMDSAVFCKIFGIAPVFFQKYVMGTLCVLLHFILLYLVGKELFKKQAEKVFLFASVSGGLNFFFVSEFTTSHFLLFRSYEAKAFCANVIIPMMFLVLLRIHKEPDRKQNWKFLFLVALSSVPISMSAILIVPLMIGIGVLAEAIINRNVKIIGYGILCMIPNGIYLII